MLTLHNLATTYNTRPSKILGIEDDYTAYQIDLVAIWHASRRNKGKGSRPSNGRDAGGLQLMPGETIKNAQKGNGQQRMSISREQYRAMRGKRNG